MTDDQFYYIMVALGFGFGTIFWFLVLWLVFGWGGK